MNDTKRTKEEVLSDIVHYIDVEGMNSVEAWHFYEEVHAAIFEHFNAEGEE
jgi:hypothetical protein